MQKGDYSFLPNKSLLIIWVNLGLENYYYRDRFVTRKSLFPSLLTSMPEKRIMHEFFDHIIKVLYSIAQSTPPSSCDVQARMHHKTKHPSYKYH